MAGGLLKASPAVEAPAVLDLSEGESIVEEVDAEESDRRFRYGKKGFEYESEDGSTFLWLGFRLQGRYDSLPGQIKSTGDLIMPDNGEWRLNRGRIKGGGHLLSESFQIYSEYDFTTDTWLDYRATWKFGDWSGLRVGQWKSDFNRERIDSSGAQQFVDRSLSNYWFTIDRQLGVAAEVRIGKEKVWDSLVWLEFLSGGGLGSTFEGDSGLWMLRWQWNPQGEPIGFGQSDLERRKELVSAVSLATVYGDTHYTRFSSSGGGQLPGFGYGDYRLFQMMFETAAKWRGMSWQQELHWKEIEDRRVGGRRHVAGGYAQVGAFPSECWSWFPDPMELVARMAYVDPDISLSSDGQWEWMIGANWYFNGHRNKLSTDLALVDIDDPVTGSKSDLRLRVQWDVSF
ncbi:porin [Haloferula sp.]|uniref:porin n=1 Tax=Haloferula sp. TaxID=2497595 RepID=UPI00329CDA4A